MVGGAASWARAGGIANPIARPAATAEPMNSRRDRSSLSLAMGSPEKSHPMGGMAASNVPSADQTRARQAEPLVLSAGRGAFPSLASRYWQGVRPLEPLAHA